MQITKTLRRSIASILLTAGLVYPACAAVCPKGIGGCTAPGRCFLFVDADGNSLCDYTGRTTSQSTTGLVSSDRSTSAQVPTVSSPDTMVTPASQGQSSTASASASVSSITPDTTTAVVQNSSTGGLLESLNIPPILAEVILFVAMTGLFLALFRAGFLGTRIKGMPRLALASFFGLGLSLITTTILEGDSTVGFIFSLVYMTAGSLLVAYLWHTGIMNRRIAGLAAGIALLAGFIFLAPIMPMELGGIVSVATGASAITVGIIVIGAVIVLALLIGRTFCGSICPVGVLQELAYTVPGTKILLQHTRILEIIRFVLFVATTIAAIYLIDLMAFTGIYDLFSLTISTGFITAAALLLLSVFLYRPICRILCPFGLLFSVFAEFSLFRLRRSEACIGCKKCERACPASTAGRNDSKRECYLCGRCTAACPVPTALRYGRE